MKWMIRVLLMSLAAPVAEYGQAEQETGLEDQSDVAVTVYNNNRALVRDRRRLTLPTGEVSLTFMDVAEHIMPETVSLKSLSEAGSLHILEQNYEYDLMSPQKLMEKYVGRKVRLINKQKDMDFIEQEAVLLSVNGGAIYDVDGEIYLGHPGTVVLPAIPEELIAKPSLIWLLDNSRADQEIEATYLTTGLAWKADYVVTLAQDEQSLDLDGWVTLNNQSGTTYTNAQLKLVAGEVNVVQQAKQVRAFAGGGFGAMEMRAPMREESFAEYHLYSLPRRTTIKQNQSKQVSLLNASGVRVGKVYEYRGNLNYYNRQAPRIEAEKVGVFLVFENEEENQLGMPLPAGIMRVYQEDSDGMLQFSGEDRIGHTPKDEEVRLKLGKAFDIVAERLQKNYTRISNRVHESEFEITIRNHKETGVVVDVVEPMPGDWEIRKESMAHVKKDAHTAIYRLPVPADGEATLTYRVRVQY